MTELIRRDGSVAETKGPARGYSWEPFVSGNVVAARHGARSERLVSQRAQVVLAEMLEEWPWLSEADGVVLDVLVQAKARHDALDEYVAGVIAGTIAPYPIKGRPTSGVEAVPDRVWQQLSREARTIIDAAGKLGFTATDRSSLYKDAGLAYHFGAPNLQQLGEQGRKLRKLRGRI